LLQMESARAADATIHARKQAQEADLAIQDHKNRLADYDLNLQTYLADNKLTPVVTVNADNNNDFHQQAVAGLSTVADANGGKVPPIVTTNSPVGAGADPSNHVLRAYAAVPAQVQGIRIDPKTKTVPKIVNDVRAAQGQLPMTDTDWAQLGSTPELSDPSKGLQARTARQLGQKQAIEQAMSFVGTPDIVGGDSSEQVAAKNGPPIQKAQQQLTNYQNSLDPDSKFAALLQNRVDTLKSGVDNAGQRADAAKAATIRAAAFPEAQAAALKVVAENTGDAGDAKTNQARRQANVEQAVKMGDPEAAAQLLQSRTTTISELKSRGATPEYIQRAITATQKLEPGYNAIVEDNNAKIAGSEANNQFFGNVNSLVAPGGTLDQLKAVGDKISQSDYQILNRTRNWKELQTGKGGISAYAAKAVGVADDYSKVVGGGVGSDASRNLVLQIISPNLSPDQRGESIEAVRDSVNSQKETRIGNNSFLKKMYSTVPTSPPPKGADFFKQHGGQAVQ
jgi:hypothetical protein